jgi:hypothetical protein
MILTIELNPVTKISLSPCPNDSSLHQIVIECVIDSKDGSKSKWQFFLTDDEMIQFEDAVSSYNRGFVDR